MKFLKPTICTIITSTFVQATFILPVFLLQDGSFTYLVRRCGGYLKKEAARARNHDVRQVRQATVVIRTYPDISCC